MQALKFETRLDAESNLRLAKLPLEPGADVEVIVLHRESEPNRDAYSLRGEPIEYKDPTEPVAFDDWESTR